MFVTLRSVFLGGGQGDSPGRYRPASEPNSFAGDVGEKVLAFGKIFDFRSQPEVAGKY